MNTILSVADLFIRSAVKQKNFNLRGLPLIPRSYWSGAPYHRSSFNQFILWIDRLGLGSASQVVDAGANHGDFAQAASAIFPTAQVLLVEPSPLLHKDLERRCHDRKPLWSLAKCALGAEKGTAILHIDLQHDAIGTLVGFTQEYLEANPNAAPAQDFPCEVETLDSLCAEKGIHAIDLLKIDVEGFEFEALKGGQSILERTRAVAIELSLVRRETGGDTVIEMLSLLRRSNFELVALEPSLYSKKDPWRPVEFNLLARKV